MKLIRSAFWLGMAFMLIGPHVDLNGSASRFSKSSIAATEHFLGDALNNAPCSSLECFGTKAVLNVGLAQLSERAIESQQALGTGEAEQHEIMLSGGPSGNTPFPQPRLVRKG